MQSTGSVIQIPDGFLIPIFVAAYSIPVEYWMDMLMRGMPMALQQVSDMHLCSIEDGTWILEWVYRVDLQIIQSMPVQNVEK